MVDGGTDGDLLDHALIVVEVGLGEAGQPAPLVGSGLGVQVAAQIGAEGEERLDLLGDGIALTVHASGPAHDHGLTVQLEPNVLVQTLLVDVVVQLHHLGTCPFHGAEGEHEGHVGSVHALRASLGEDLHDLEGGLLPGEGAVGVVEEHHVDIGGGQKLCLLADNPLVIAVVVAVDRLIPEVVEAHLGLDAQLAKLGNGQGHIVALGLTHLNELIDILLIVEGGLPVTEIAVPGPVEDGDDLVLADISRLGVGGNDTIQAVLHDPLGLIHHVGGVLIHGGVIQSGVVGLPLQVAEGGDLLGGHFLGGGLLGGCLGLGIGGCLGGLGVTDGGLLGAGILVAGHHGKGYQSSQSQQKQQTKTVLFHVGFSF